METITARPVDASLPLSLTSLSDRAASLLRGLQQGTFNVRTGLIAAKVLAADIRTAEGRATRRSVDMDVLRQSIDHWESAADALDAEDPGPLSVARLLLAAAQSAEWGSSRP